MDAFNKATSTLEKSTLVVNLEPCSHYGKTPPCVDEIIRQKISTIIIGTKDPNPLVAGRGIQKLRKSGIKVISGILEKECKKFNETFFKFITLKKPFVTLKIAQTLDGKIADTKNNSQWITSEESRKHVHSIRAEYDAVLIGAGTLRTDNPSLTVRLVKGRNPHKIIIDGNFTSLVSCKVFQKQHKERILFFTSKNCYNTFPQKIEKLMKRGVEIFPLYSTKNNSIKISEILSLLAEQNISSVLVEGGASMYSQFLEQKLADKILFFVAPKIMGQGKNAFELYKNSSLHTSVNLHDISFRSIEGDIFYEGYV